MTDKNNATITKYKWNGRILELHGSGDVLLLINFARHCGVWAGRWFRRYSPLWNNAFEGNKNVRHLVGLDRRKRSLNDYVRSSTNWVSVPGLEKDFLESPQGLGYLLCPSLTMFRYYLHVTT
jgi:hypothetical protein